MSEEEFRVRVIEQLDRIAIALEKLSNARRTYPKARSVMTLSKRDFKARLRAIGNPFSGGKPPPF